MQPTGSFDDDYEEPDPSCDDYEQIHDGSVSCYVALYTVIIIKAKNRCSKPLNDT